MTQIKESNQETTSTNNDIATSVSKHNAKLPIWVLTPQEEIQARKNLKKFTYEKCNDYVKAMADCAKLNGVKVFPTCNSEKEKMKECLLFYQLDKKYLDEQRDLVILNKIEKRLQQNKQSSG
ncbi:Cmc1p PWA37_001268 [Arxiozyma heterogenica]|uniref:COX assembly mitochondrial protein n=1 Tax=Arxiozyma heterogenica TaxID=278026 RepID=A0AAN7WLJ2_9SACH|nr:hypothetical protein RI543_003758 [Kazachstania heterogenica]